MKKILLAIFIPITLSACSATELKSFSSELKSIGTELLLPNSTAAQISQLKRQHKLHLFTEHPDINLALLEKNPDLMYKPLINLEYQIKMFQFTRAYRLSLLQPIEQINKQIAEIQYAKNNYIAPKTYEQCLRGVKGYNAYGYIGEQCFESVTLNHSDAWRKQETQKSINNFNNQLNNLYKTRQSLINKAKNAGADTTVLSLNQKSSEQINIAQHQMRNICNTILKRDIVKWMHLKEYNRGKELIVQESTATKNNSECLRTIFTGYSGRKSDESLKYINDEAERLYRNTVTQTFGLQNKEIWEILRKYGK